MACLFDFAHDGGVGPACFPFDEGSDEEFFAVVVDDDESFVVEFVEVFGDFCWGEVVGAVAPSFESDGDDAGWVDVGLADEEHVEALGAGVEGDEVVAVVPHAYVEFSVFSDHCWFPLFGVVSWFYCLVWGLLVVGWVGNLWCLLVTPLTLVTI